MKIPIYQVDAFTGALFSGNPAAVCPLEGAWLDDKIMQKIAFENNLSETAFVISRDHEYHIRWFTPRVEVDLCGHATLAAAHVYFEHEGFSGKTISFHSRSGLLGVEKNDNLYIMDFPSDQFNEVDMTPEIAACFNIRPEKAFKGSTDYMLVYSSQRDIARIQYSLDHIAKLNSRAVIITAPGDDVDFVSRVFAPQCGIDEDPVTGSAHTTLAPYWSKVLKKEKLTAVQLSERRGYLECACKNDRTLIGGEAVTFLKGKIII